MSEAIVAETKQVPEVDAVIVADADELERAQLVALPPATIAYVIAPVPEDPEVDMESACEYGNVFDEVPSDEKVIVWLALTVELFVTLREASEIASLPTKS